MLVYAVDVLVKKGHEEDFLTAIEKNRRGSRKEPGNLRFDVSQSMDNPASFFIYEVYISEQAVSAHKETNHYKAWRDTVAPWMEEPRRGRKFDSCLPQRVCEW